MKSKWLKGNKNRLTSEMMIKDQNTKYYLAYISYSRKDEEWANWIQNKLEHYVLPEPIAKEYGSRHLRPFFRGVNDLAAGVLTESLNHAFDSSQYLIVVCSPHAARSHWVDLEIEYFIQKGRTDSIIPVIVDGKPFSGEETECYPNALRQLKGENEILGINVVELGKNVALTKIVARTLGISFDTLWARYKRDQGVFSRITDIFHWVVENIRPSKQDYIVEYTPKIDDTRIFISYRRDDGQGPARAVQQALIGRFGEECVFFDFTSLEDKKFNLQILDAIYSCNDFILVLSPKSMKKCSRKTDWVALEIRTAIKYNKHIIPINIDNKFFGWPKRFPKDLDELKYEQQLDFQMGTYFGASLEKLLKRLTTKPTSQVATTQTVDCHTELEQKILLLISDTINKVLEGNFSHQNYFYKVRTNKKCTLFLDDVECCRLEPNTLIKVPLERGQYLVSFKLEGANDPVLEKKLSIEYDIFDDFCF